MILSEVINHKTTYVSFMTYYIDCRPGQCLPSVLVTSSGGSVVEHPLREREVVGSASGRAIQKALKMVPVANLRGAQHYKTKTGLSSNKYHTTNISKLTKANQKSCSIIINVCIHRRIVSETVKRLLSLLLSLSLLLHVK